MKKVTQKKAPPKKRVLVETWNLDTTYYTRETQLAILQKKTEFPRFFQEIERKIQGYKHQDVEKKVLDSENVVCLGDVLYLLSECAMTCHYCKQNIFVLYEMARENCQWTLDRIDNSEGHNRGNVLISCLECNLKRRCRSKDKFLMGKQLQITREGRLRPLRGDVVASQVRGSEAASDPDPPPGQK